jgi:hypothetical protein
MAWEWISSVSSGVVGVSAIVGAGWTATRTRKNDRLLAKERHDHERLTAHEQWIRDHRKDAYLTLVNLSEEASLYVQRVHPMMDTDPPRPVPDLPGLDAQREARTKVIAFGSQEVKARMRIWHEIVVRASFAAAAISEGNGEYREQLHDLRQQERDAREALGEQVAAELQELGGGGPGIDAGDR